MQEEFVKEDKSKELSLEREKQEDESLDEYQKRRIRALTKIMNEVIKEAPEIKKDKKHQETVAQLFGLDNVYDKGMEN